MRGEMVDSVKQLIVVSDLDGTLLDHHDYSFEEVLPVLDRMDAAGIPLVINTSKTKAEWLAMRHQFGNENAFIIENGSAIYDGDEVTVFGTPRAEILSILKEFRDDFQFTGYADVKLETIMEWTGLSRKDASRSANREFSEPLVWQDTPEKEDEFSALIEAKGLKTLRGGRFLHVLGDCDKGRPLDYFIEDDIAIIALGDRPNDLAMLEKADIGVIIASPDGYALEASEELLRSQEVGPRGWVEMMTLLLDRIAPPEFQKSQQRPGSPKNN